MKTGDLLICSDLAIAFLRPLRTEDWERRAGDLEWTCERTLDHIIDTMLLYSAYVATRATGRRQPVRNGQEFVTIADLLDSLDATARILDLVCEGTPPPLRAFHPSGLSDASGFRAMGCSEILTHTDDIAQGFSLSFTAPFDLCDRIIDRVFPWAPDSSEHPDRWEVVKWACGRMALPTRERLDENWWWHSAPIAEWDGSRTQRTTPPQWQ